MPMGAERKPKFIKTTAAKTEQISQCNALFQNQRPDEVNRELLAEISFFFREDDPLSTIVSRVLNTLYKYSGSENPVIWLVGLNGVELVPVVIDTNTLLANGIELANKVREKGTAILDENGTLGVPLYNHKELIGVLTIDFETQVDPISGHEAFWEALSHHLGMEIHHHQMSNQLRLLFDKAQDMIGIMGSDRYFKKVNPAMCQQLGYSEKELLDLSLDMLVHPGDLTVSRERTKNFMQGGDQTMYFENRFLGKSGKPVWISWTVTRSAEQGLMFCVGKNISEKKEMENLLHRANELARIGSWEADRVKGTAYWSSITREIYEVSETFVPSIDNWLSFYREGTDRDYIASKMADLIATGKPCDVEVEMVTALGNRRWIRSVAEGEFVDGECVRVYGSFQDIDYRKRAELAAIAALEERNDILERIGDGFFAVDRNWVITYWNTAAERTMGKSRTDMLGNCLWSQYPEVVEMEFYQQYQKAMQTDKPIHFESFYPLTDTWFCVDAYPSKSGLSVFFKDITEVKSAAKVLEESEKRYSDLFHLNPLPMFVYEMSTLRYVDVNLAAIEHYGYSREEFLSMTILDIRPPEDIPLVEQTVAKLQAQPKARLEGIFRHRKKNGEIIRVDIQSNMIIFHGAQCKVVLANDVTERLRYIEAIETQNEKLKDIAWMQSHVIRAPLSRIMGLLPMLHIKGAEAEQQKVYDYLFASAHELDDVIRSITGMSGTVQVKRE
jgi:PAS domain S-box-containing protein